MFSYVQELNPYVFHVKNNRRATRCRRIQKIAIKDSVGVFKFIKHVR